MLSFIYKNDTFLGKSNFWIDKSKLTRPRPRENTVLNIDNVVRTTRVLWSNMTQIQYFEHR